MGEETLIVGRCCVCQRDDRLLRVYVRNDTGKQAWACHDEIDCCNAYGRGRKARAIR
jgi:hypothetical protein